MVLPTGYGRTGDTLFLHGSSANRALLAADGQEICVTVTHLDGLVCARSVFNHSMNYRSAVIFGTARMITGDSERLAALQAVHRAARPWPVGVRQAADPQGARRHRGSRAAAGRGVGEDPRRRAA